MAIFFHDKISTIFDGDNKDDAITKITADPTEQFKKAFPIPSYTVTKGIGSGQFSFVFSGFENDTKTRRAFKYTPEAFVDKTVQKEFDVLKSLNHPNIIQYIQLIHLPKQSFVYVMELCEFGNLDDLIKEYLAHGLRIPEKRVMEIFSDVVTGLAVMHDARLVHRNLKPINIFLKPDGHVALGGSETETCWLLYYTAPELLIARGSEPTKESDVWSAGIVLNQLIRLQLPFLASQQIASFVNAENLPGMPPGYSKKAQTLSEAILQREPIKRPPTRNILAALK